MTTKPAKPPDKPLTYAEVKLLCALGRLQPCRAAYLGQELWSQPARKPQDYARPSGAMLKRLEARGLVASDTSGRWKVWRITGAGEKELLK